MRSAFAGGLDTPLCGPPHFTECYITSTGAFVMMAGQYNPFPAPYVAASAQTRHTPCPPPPPQFACHMTAFALQHCGQIVYLSIDTCYVVRDNVMLLLQSAQCCKQMTSACIVFSTPLAIRQYHIVCIVLTIQHIRQSSKGQLFAVAVAGTPSRTLARYRPSTILLELSPSSLVYCCG